ncbi:MAG: hypothetical protein ACRERU_19340 [Methylococcales bacterium]
MVCENCGTDLAPIHRLRDLAVFHYNAALASVDRGDDAAAIREVYAALATDPSWLAVRVLLGKLLWKSGRREEAKAEWCLAAQEYPDDATVNALLDATKQTPSRRFPHLPTVSAAIGIAFVAFFAGIMTVDTRQMDAPRRSELPVVTQSYDGSQREGQNSPPVPLSVEKSVTSNHEAKRGSLPAGISQESGISAKPINNAITKPPAIPKPFENLSARLKATEGLHIEHKNGFVRVIPLEGLFPIGSSEPHANGEALLRMLADVINSAETPVKIRVIGFTDALPTQKRGRWSANWQLALYRAASTIALMKIGNHHEWLASFGDEEQPPFPNNSDLNRQRNRTVIIEVLPQIES